MFHSHGLRLDLISRSIKKQRREARNSQIRAPRVSSPLRVEWEQKNSDESKLVFLAEPLFQGGVYLGDPDWVSSKINGVKNQALNIGVTVVIRLGVS